MTVYSPDLTTATDLGDQITVKDLKIVQLCLLILIWSVYLLSLLGVLQSIRHQQLNMGSLLLSLYFIGGYVFQLFWETKGRYCIPYFVVLIILSGIEMARIPANVHRRIGKHDPGSVSVSTDRT